MTSTARVLLGVGALGYATWMVWFLARIVRRSIDRWRQNW